MTSALVANPCAVTLMQSLSLAAVNWHSFFFYLFALVTCGFAVAVLLAGNVVRMAFYLIISLAGAAGLFFLAGAQFVGAMQIMIYVGGTLVLLIFGVMLTAQAAFVNMKTSAGEWTLAAIIGGSLLFLLVHTALSVEEWREVRPDQATLAADEGQDVTALGAGFIGYRPDSLHQTDDTLRRGMSGYLLPFEIVSIHLLIVLVGAAYLARSKQITGAGLRVAGKPDDDSLTASAGAKRRPALVSSVLGFLMLTALVGAVTSFFARSKLQVMLADYAPELTTTPEWVYVGGGLLALGMFLMLLVIWNWQRWGFYGVVALMLAKAAMIGAAGMGMVWVTITLVGGAIFAGLLYELLQVGRPSVWRQLE